MRDSGAESAKDMGIGDEAGDGRGRRPRRRQARVGAGAGGARGMRTQIELSNEVAAELAGSQDAVLRALEAHLDCKVFLRGNLLTFDGEETRDERRRARGARARRADRPRPPDRPGHDHGGDRRARRARIARAGARGRRLEPPRAARRAEDGQPEALRGLGPREHDHLRRRARRAPARPSSRSRWPPPRSRATRSTASSSRAPPSRPASGSASCRAT